MCVFVCVCVYVCVSLEKIVHDVCVFVCVCVCVSVCVCVCVCVCVRAFFLMVVIDLEGSIQCTLQIYVSVAFFTEFEVIFLLFFALSLPLNSLSLSVSVSECVLLLFCVLVTTVEFRTFVLISFFIVWSQKSTVGPYYWPFGPFCRSLIDTLRISSLK